MTRPMRILWAVNIPLPAASSALGLPRTPFGGWLSTMTQRLGRTDGVHLAVAMRAPVAELRSAEVEGIRYFALPGVGKGGLDARDRDCREILDAFEPDLLHAEGSEMAYTRRMLAAWAGPRLLSLQGVINGYEPFELGRLPLARMFGSLRLRQMLPALALPLKKHFSFAPRLRGERETIAMADHIMGRTPWDRAQAWAINPSATYHHCSRTLRDAFHGQRWRLADADRHSIFVGNAASPRKGVHVLLESLLLLRREFPRARIVVAGEKPAIAGLRGFAGYPAYLADRIAELGLEDSVEFTGLLDAECMVEAMTRCHVFAMTSLIENSPNTLGEAMMLGMPCVSAYAGGTPGMARDEQEALFFRAGDPSTLAYQVKRLFESDELCQVLGSAAHDRARQTHDPNGNLQDLLAAYRAILHPEGAR